MISDGVVAPGSSGLGGELSGGLVVVTGRAGDDGGRGPGGRGAGSRLPVPAGWGSPSGGARVRGSEDTHNGGVGYGNRLNACGDQASRLCCGR
ncbi:hypothetical protein FPZ41_42695 [Streptomyces sp. K1PN6]|uniref:Uncharacterized protein n=1 Tax=Streptomyces acidicola TaxID=2596892 RepID=A0A5N8X8K9_9ACTN|nr:hypothetical protein [Streptomyces acidicola]